VTGLVKPFIKVFFSSLIFLIVVCLWAGNLNNLLGLAFMSAFCGGLWALISVGDAPHHSGKDLTTSAKKRNNSTPSSRSIKDAAVSNPVISSDSNNKVTRTAIVRP
jgi:hypothetical protein